MCQVVATVGEMGYWNLSSSVSSISSVHKALRTGWGTHLQDLTAAGIWREEECNLHINIMPMKAVQLSLNETYLFH